MPSAKKRDLLATTRPQKHHLDGNRAASLLSVDVEDDGDDLLTPRDVSHWLNVSTQWLALGRCNGYGPKFKRISTRRIAYRRDDVRKWLTSRTFSCTKQYTQGAV
jgi:hypothetical protein